MHTRLSIHAHPSHNLSYHSTMLLMCTPSIHAGHSLIYIICIHPNTSCGQPYLYVPKARLTYMHI